MNHVDVLHELTVTGITSPSTTYRIYPLAFWYTEILCKFGRSQDDCRGEIDSVERIHQ